MFLLARRMRRVANLDISRKGVACSRGTAAIACNHPGSSAPSVEVSLPVRFCVAYHYTAPKPTLADSLQLVVQQKNARIARSSAFKISATATTACVGVVGRFLASTLKSLVLEQHPDAIAGGLPENEFLWGLLKASVTPVL